MPGQHRHMIQFAIVLDQGIDSYHAARADKAFFTNRDAAYF